MFTPSISHKYYVRFVGRRAMRGGGIRTDHRHFAVWRKLKETNLAGADPLLAAVYSAEVGRPARPGVSMLRSCLAMMLCGETSFTDWVALLHDEHFYALISGFEPDDVPGVGTFYDFQDRLLKRVSQGRSHLRVPHQRREEKDKASHHQDKNDLRPHQGIVDRLAERIAARPEPSPSLAAILEGQGDLARWPVWERTLPQLFYACFVSRSVELELIDLDEVHVADEGAKLPTWANPHGHKRCDCDNRGKKGADRCRCQRAYADPLALWGWDSYRKCWVYGHSFYELTAYSLKHTCQLPLVVSMADCNRHDSVLGLVSLYRAQELFAFDLQTASLDAAHDALAYYRLATQRWQMALVIPVNERNHGHLQYAGPLRLEEGVPICLADKPMTRCGFCPDRLRIKWRCPLAAAKKADPLPSCPFFANACSGSDYGRVIYTYPKENYRLHTLIPRESDLFRAHRHARSCAERSVKRKKYDFQLLQTQTAGRERWFFRLMLAAMCQHIDAWLNHASEQL